MSARTSDRFEAGMVVREAGVFDGRRPVVWVHGLGESSRCFLEVLADPRWGDLPHLLPDLPGYGRSPWPANEPAPTALPASDDRSAEASLAQHADHLAAWLRGRGIPQVTVIGHSMGAIVGLHLAERHPDLVHTLIDVEGNKTPPDCAFSSVAAAYPRDAYRADGHAALLARVHGAGVEDPAQRGYFVSMSFADPGVLHADAIGLVVGSRGGQFATRLAAIPRALYVPGVGGSGGAAPGSVAAVRAAGVPIEPVGPSGHWPFIDAPDAFVAAVRPWCD